MSRSFRFTSRKIMKKLTASLAMLAVVGIAKADVTNYWANGDFESLPAGTNWAQNSGGGTFFFGFPASGGNPGGYAVITNTTTVGYAVLIAGNTPQSGDPIPIAPLGLVADGTYTFIQDMITFTPGGGLEPESKLNHGVLMARSAKTAVTSVLPEIPPLGKPIPFQSPSLRVRLGSRLCRFGRKTPLSDLTTSV